MSRKSFLLDTNIFLFLLTKPAKIPKKLRNEFSDPGNFLSVSQVSLLEIGFKVGTGKLEFPLKDFDECRESLDAGYLPITLEHIITMVELPKHHRDPYDRLLVAQAKVLKMVLVSSDPELERYGDGILIIP